MTIATLEKSTTLKTCLSPKLLALFQSCLEDRQRNNWTPDSSGKFFSAKISVDAMESFARSHPKYKLSEIDLDDLDVNSCFEAMQRMSKKRGGRVSSFDEKVIKTVVMILRYAALPVDDHQKLLKSISKRSTNRSRPHIKRRALEMRGKIIAYCILDEIPKGHQSFHVYRNKAMLAILLTCSPLRVNTLTLLRREHCHDSLISIPADSSKGREAISFTLTPLAAYALERYLNVCPRTSGFLFTNITQSRMTRNSIYKSLRRYCETILDAKLGTHDFRRIIATAVGQHVGQEFAAATLAVSLNVLKNHYDLSDSSQKLDAAIRRINEELK